MRLNLCLTPDHPCSRQEWCPAHGVWAEAQNVMLGVLQGVSIGDLAREVAARNGSGAVTDAPKQN
jgi:DNA-binding IscR family transcriptional regulator